MWKKDKKTAVLELLFKEVSKNKETPSQVFSGEFCETLKNTILQNISDGVGICLLKSCVL